MVEQILYTVKRNFSRDYNLILETQMGVGLNPKCTPCSAGLSDITYTVFLVYFFNIEMLITCRNSLICRVKHRPEKPCKPALSFKSN